MLISLKETIILIGSTKLGKTHIATGLALAACKQGKRLRFFSTNTLVNDLLSAQKDLRLSKFTAQVSKLDLVVLDELGFIPFSRDGANCFSSCVASSMSGFRSLSLQIYVLENGIKCLEMKK